MSSARHRLELVAFRLARMTSSLVPERWAVRLGALTGRFVGSVLRVRRRDVDRHLELAFPDRDRSWRSRVAQQSYAHLGREACVLFRGSGWDRDRVLDRTHTIGFEAFAEEARRGLGVVLLTGHLGNWEIGGAAIVARGVPLDVVGKGMSNRMFQDELFARRRLLGMRVVEMGDAAAQALKTLGEGRVVALLGDQSAHRAGLRIPFFGVPAATARGPALFAVRSGAPVFVAFALRDPGPEPRYSIRFERLSFEPSGDLERDVRVLLAAYTGALESAIREAPAQYFWHHRRWKEQASEEPPSEG